MSSLEIHSNPQVGGTDEEILFQMLYLSNNNDNNTVTALRNVLYFHHMISNLFIEFYFMSDVAYILCLYFSAVWNLIVDLIFLEKLWLEELKFKADKKDLENYKICFCLDYWG